MRASSSASHQVNLPAIPSNFLPPDPSATLPIANITRLMKTCLPSQAKISSQARDAILECVIEMIGFVTSEANAKSSQEKRKTVNGDDVLFAFHNLGFDNYAQVLTVFLTRYRDLTLSNVPSDGDSQSTSKKKRGPKSSKGKARANRPSQDLSEDEDQEGEDDQEERERDGEDQEDESGEDEDDGTFSRKGTGKSARGKRGRGTGRGRGRGRSRGRPKSTKK